MKGLIAVGAVSFLVTLVGCAPPEKAVGKQIFDGNCTVCHGSAGRGDGPHAALLDRPVPDLALITKRNGGSFPLADVMSTINGYTRAKSGSTVMPGFEFGAEMANSSMILFDTGDGIATPTPSKLIAIAEYLQSIQQ